MNKLCSGRWDKEDQITHNKYETPHSLGQKKGPGHAIHEKEQW